MSHVRLSAMAIACAIVTTIIVGVVTVSSSARAQSAGKAQCTEIDTFSGPAQAQAWMNQQIAAGRTHFALLGWPCAW